MAKDPKHVWLTEEELAAVKPFMTPEVYECVCLGNDSTRVVKKKKGFMGGTGEDLIGNLIRMLFF